MLDRTFDDLLVELSHEDRFTPTHADPFFTLVHEPAQTLELHARLRRWGSVLEKRGFDPEVHSLGALAWDIVEASGRWDDWLDVEERGQYLEASKSMRDVLQRAGEGKSLLSRVEQILAARPRANESAPERLVLLTDTALLHPWGRVDKLVSSLHDKISCPTVLFYPGRRMGVYSLRFLDFYPEDGGSPRTTILGSL
jgi:hypothetical protein